MDKDTFDAWVKQGLALLAAGCAGFYLGGRHVGKVATPAAFIEQPEWISTAKTTLWAVMVLFALAVVAWLIIDYREIQG